MPKTSPTQPGGNQFIALLRHYDRVAHNRTSISSKTRSTKGIERKNRHVTQWKWVAFCVIILSMVLLATSVIAELS
ncbi:MAG: hypothetical protein H7Y36_08730 [Armatimonadetes bacterium]|nr:hypothetical protein [Akkermansiaceae bacterium]